MQKRRSQLWTKGGRYFSKPPGQICFFNLNTSFCSEGPLEDGYAVFGVEIKNVFGTFFKKYLIE